MSDPGNQFAKLLVKHDRELRRYIAMLLPRQGDVEEVLQRTATILWEKFSAYDAERPFAPWAMRFAYFEVLNYRKEYARSRMIYSEDVIELLSDSYEQISDELVARRQAFRSCLSKVHAEDRVLLDRRYGDCFTVKALALETGRTAKSIYRRLDRIRDAIAACVDREIASIGE